ncbi:MAG: polysaccharide deacetylase family protein [Campylobacterota bacterium]
MRIIFSLLIYIFINKSLLYAEINNQEISKELNSAVIFMYHRFGDDRYPSTNITIEQFEKHLEYIEKNSFNVWPLSKIVRYIIEGKKLPKKTVALTIDDAYISTYTEAYPRLKKRSFPFTIFVSTNAVDGSSKNYMNWSELREMSMNGAEFANHSLTHDYLLSEKPESSKQWRSRIKSEIQGAQRRLHEELGDKTNENPKLFSYPFGEYDKNVIKLLKELDYVGITQTSGVFSSDTDLRTLPRFAMAEAYGNIEDFILKINTLPLPVKSLSPTEPIVRSNNPPLLELKLQRAIDNLQCYISSGEKIEIEWISKTELKMQAKNPLKAPRDRYTCTAPAKEGRWYWHSNLWIIK